VTAKEYLMQAFRSKKKIASLREDIQRLEDAATDCSANLTGMPHNQSPSQSRMADIVCKMVDRKAELQKMLLESESLIAETKFKISYLENSDYKDILYRRYIECQEWQDIAAAMTFAESYIFRLHRKALAAFERVLLKEDS
jgi:DNA-directed RNA polymerase specialized sigma subunit